MTKYEIAKVAHEINRAYCKSIKDETQLSWEEAPEWQKKSAVTGVGFHIDNPNAGVDDSHESWLQEKCDDGWKYGPQKNIEKKEHPCCIPYKELPMEQQAKDYLFRSVVHQLKDFL